ncbi:MAG: sulfotransferase domain-containing protein [Halanaerobiales bacterium]
MPGKIPYFIKKFLNLFHYHRKNDKKDIFVFSSFRSGSTWLAEIIHSEPGVKFPISPNKIEFLEPIDSRYKKIQPRPFYIRLSAKEKKIIADYIRKASRGEIVYGQRYVDLFSRSHNFVTERSVFRLLRSTYLIDWIIDEFDIHSLYLIRHPIATSLSRKKIWQKSNNPSYWKPKIDYIYNSDSFRQNFLTPKLESFLEEKLETCSKLEEFVITWCIENLPPIRKIQEGKNQFIFLTYEDLLINSKKVLSFICEHLYLENKKLMLERIHIPSSTVRYSDRKTKDKFNKNTYSQEYLLKKWKKEVTTTEIEKVQIILNAFDIHIYNASSFMPQTEYLKSTSENNSSPEDRP